MPSKESPGPNLFSVLLKWTLKYSDEISVQFLSSVVEISKAVFSAKMTCNRCDVVDFD